MFRTPGGQGGQPARSSGSFLDKFETSKLGQRHAFDKAVQLAKAQHGQQLANVQLPDWIKPTARLGYMSRSSGRMCEVIVDSVSKVKQEVKVVFAEDRGTWKGIPFSMIMSRSNPLRQLHSSDLLTPAKVDRSTPLQREQAPEKPLLSAKPAAGPVAGPAAGPANLPIAQPLVGSITQKAIQDSAIAASSYFMNNPRHGFTQMWRARIDNADTAWRAAADNVNQCIRWDFASLKEVTKIWTKGSAVEDHWVTQYDLSYTTDGKTWTRLNKSFPGNKDRDTLVEQAIGPLRATMLKLHPLAWHSHVGMRAEVFGFPVEEEEPADAVGPKVAESRSKSRSPRR
eukprot:TRINITY_DN36096_c0_g1_i1.p1 TRINITY_DN36096_c0_g1~~TRINITY_DN36096_c0_g1_i1.p1  ORF type:complete len:341 (+),score=60.71 TRINITY_DN36096_c0_g1_i1:56-1078(+)